MRTGPRRRPGPPPNSRQAADRHKDKWPAGVEVRAVPALAPAYNVTTEDMTAYEIARIPVAVLRGTCDGQVGREAFFRRYLTHDTRFDDMLNGERHPLAHLAHVDVTAARP